jgi:serine/threonine-protein kinase
MLDSDNPEAMADPPVPEARRFRFGPFEFDVRTGELHNRGTRVPLHQHSVQILGMLLDRAGEVVLRDEIHRRLWPAHGAIESDDACHAAIQELRDALGDPADRPRLLETVARRGYVFVGQVERIDDGSQSPNPAPESDPTRTMSGLLPDQTVANRFRIVRPLGQGGMGRVYEAEDLALHVRIALKIIRPDIAANPSAIERFKSEVLLGRRVAHPNVCRIYDFGTGRAPDGSEQFFITMQLLEGETLSARIKRGPLPEDEALPLIQDMADGLLAGHRAGIVHRDFKSGNVMLVRSGASIRALITDFGLARYIGPSGETTPVTETSGVVGTVGYMAPEQIRGEPATPATDVYAFGVVMFEMLTGKRPFTGDSNLAIAMQHVTEPPPAPRSLAPQLDPKWDGVILGCLRKGSAERFPSTAEVMSALHSNLPAARPAPQPLRLPRPAKLAAVLLVVLAAGLVLWYARDRLFPPGPSQQRVAVLEFDNIGGDAANQAFCEGLMETLAGQLTELEQFQGSLSVVPASDVRRGKIASVRDAQREFGVNLVITGSVQRSADGIRLIVNVVDARQLKQLRSHQLFIARSDPVAMQQGVVQQVTDLLDLELLPQARRHLAQANTTVPGAYDFYLQGFGYMLTGALRADQAIAEFRHALDLDPAYALAYAGLGQAYWTKYQATKDQTWISQAWDACRRALALNPRLAASHITLAILSNGTGHYADAMQEAQQAIAIDPANFQGYSELATAEERSHQLVDAETTLKSAISRRPSYWNSYVRLGSFYERHGRYKDAEPLFQHLIELVPDNPAGYTNLGAIYHFEGREQDAVAMLNKSIQIRPTQAAYSDLGTVYFFLGRFTDAVPVYEHLAAEGTRNYVIWGNLGDAYRWTPGMRPKSLHAYDMAIQYANQALSVNPSDPAALSSLALYQAKSGQLAPALANSAKALAQAPSDSDVLFKAAVVSEIAGKRDAALSYLSKAARSGYSKNEIEVEPELQALRSDERYSRLVAIPLSR